MPATEGLSRVMIEAARALGRRAIVSRGWADLSLIDDEPDCLAVGEVNHHALFPRVAAVVHHGGAGTVTAAALAGAPQVVIPQNYDQPYWAQRVEALGIGVAHGSALTSALEAALRREVVARAAAVASAIGRDGAALAAERLVALVNAASAPSDERRG
jgi:vancomycin aglycone glucosyltransferase